MTRLTPGVAIIYTSYRFTTEVDGEVATSSGRGTEIFVFRDGRWVNPDLGLGDVDLEAHALEDQPR